jgi:hypothetical protein
MGGKQVLAHVWKFFSTDRFSPFVKEKKSNKVLKNSKFIMNQKIALCWSQNPIQRNIPVY